MNVAVCVKQIPDPASPGKLDPTTHTLVREGKLILDDSDSYGVEMALQLVDTAGGGEVTLVSMAPNAEVSGLRTALAMGAHKAILISDDALKGTDALGTAKVLAAAIKRAEPDLVIAATESTDGNARKSSRDSASKTFPRDEARRNLSRRFLGTFSGRH